MKRLHRFALSLALVTLLGAAASEAADETGFVLIVNNANAVTSLPKPLVTKIFMKKVDQWNDGQRIVPIDLNGNSQTRASFSKLIHGKSTSAVKSYWQQQVFSGKGVPPIESSSDAEIVSFVQGNRGAIGYVSPLAATTGVRVVKLTD